MWQSVELALRSDKKNNKAFPDHVAAQAGKVTRAAGRLMGNAIASKYTKTKKQNNPEMWRMKMKHDAIQTIVQTIRFLENLK